MASLIQRNNTYYLQWYEGTKRRRQSLRTESQQIQIAKEKKRQIESAQLPGIAARCQHVHRSGGGRRLHRADEGAVAQAIVEQRPGLVVFKFSVEV